MRFFDSVSEEEESCHYHIFQEENSHNFVPQEKASSPPSEEDVLASILNAIESPSIEITKKNQEVTNYSTPNHKLSPIPQPEKTGCELEETIKNEWSNELSIDERITKKVKDKKKNHD